jgi:hypothetical protein
MFTISAQQLLPSDVPESAAVALEVLDSLHQYAAFSSQGRGNSNRCSALLKFQGSPYLLCHSNVWLHPKL